MPTLSTQLHGRINAATTAPPLPAAAARRPAVSSLPARGAVGMGLAKKGRKLYHLKRSRASRQRLMGEGQQ